MDSGRRKQQGGGSDAKQSELSSPRYPRRQPGGYRCKITKPVEPTILLGKRVSIRWDKHEKLDGVPTLTHKWHTGVVTAFRNADCKHQVEYDSWDGEVPQELRIGLDAPVDADLPHDPNRASRGLLEKLLTLLLSEVEGLGNVLKQLPQHATARQKASTKSETKQRQVVVVTDMLEQLRAEEAAAAAAAAVAAREAAVAAEAAACEAAARQGLPRGCAILQRVGPALAEKWAEPGQAPAEGVQQQQQEEQEQHESGLAAAEQDLLPPSAVAAMPSGVVEQQAAAADGRTAPSSSQGVEQSAAQQGPPAKRRRLLRNSQQQQQKPQEPQEQQQVPAGSGRADVAQADAAAASLPEQQGQEDPELLLRQQQEAAARHRRISKQRRSPLMPLSAERQQSTGGLSPPRLQWQEQAAAQQQDAAGKPVSEPAGRQRTRRRSEQQQQQQSAGHAAGLSAEKLEQLPAELRWLRPEWNHRSELDRRKQAELPSSQLQQQQHDQQQHPVAEPSTRHDSSQQQQQQLQRSRRSKAVSRELQQLLAEAPDVDQPPDAGRRRPSRSSRAAAPQQHASQAVADELGQAQQQEEQREQEQQQQLPAQVSAGDEQLEDGESEQATPSQAAAADDVEAAVAPAPAPAPAPEPAPAPAPAAQSQPDRQARTSRSTRSSSRQTQALPATMVSEDAALAAAAAAAAAAVAALEADAERAAPGPACQQLPTAEQQKQQQGGLQCNQQQQQQQLLEPSQERQPMQAEVEPPQPPQPPAPQQQQQQGDVLQGTAAAVALPEAGAGEAGVAGVEAHQAMQPPAPAASSGPLQRSQATEQQQGQSVDAGACQQPSQPAAVSQPAGAAGAVSGGMDAAASAGEVAATTAAAVPAPAAAAAPAVTPVFADVAAAEAAANALLRNGQVNPANIPGLQFSHVELVVQQLAGAAPMTLAEAQERLDAQQQQGETQGARLDLLCLDQELKDAYYTHTQQRHSHTLFKELDVSMRLAPEALVGRHLRVYWDNDDAWFAGSVVEWDEGTGRHKVVYDDGEVGWLWMGVERVRLLITAGEDLAPPDAATLQRLARSYTEQARVEEQKLSKAKHKAGLDPEDLERPGRLRSKGQALLGAAFIKARHPPPDTWLVKAPRLAAAGSGGGGSGRGSGKKRKSGAQTVKAGSHAAAAATPAAAAAAAAGPAEAGTPVASTAEAADAPALPSTTGLEGAADTGVVQQHQHQQQHQQQEQQEQQEQQQQDMDIDIDTPAEQGGLDSGTVSTAKRARLSVPQPADAGASILKQALQRHATQQQQQQAARVTFAEADAARSAACSLAGSREHSPAAAAAAAGAMPDAREGTEGPADGGSSNSGGSGTVTFSVRPGEVVWAQVKPNPPWPALVVSSEEADDFSVKFTNPRIPQVSIQYFGDYSRSRVPVSYLIPTEVALQQRLWLKTVLTYRKESNWANQVKLYRIGLRELITYCKDGVLPDSEMVPEHNDERWLLEECAAEREAAATAKDAAGGPGKSKQRRKVVLGASQAPPLDTPVEELLAWAASFVGAACAAGEGAAGSKGRLPLQLAPSLLLVSLGRVEYVHPRFHNDKLIFPVGFAIRRRVRLPCSSEREVWHTAEILANPDGSGPLFRVTPEGSAPVTGSSPTAAWQELYKAAPPIEGMSAKASAAAVAARAASVCGPRLFGLQHPVIAALIESLPDAALCESFLAWKGTPPAPQVTSPEVVLARRIISAQLSKLPPDVTPQVVQRRGLALCDSCGEEQEVGGNNLLECDGCGLLVHMGCYGVASHPNGEAWLCDVCLLLKSPHGVSLSGPPACALCPCVGGVMKPTAEGGWCHLLCATWVPGCFVADGVRMEPIVGTQRLPKNRLSLKCRICNQPYGACIQCAHKGCSTAFHATCARAAGYPMLMLEDDDDSDSDEDAAAAAAAADEDESSDEGPGAAAGGAGPAQQPHEAQGGQPAEQLPAAQEQVGEQSGGQQQQQGRSGRKQEGAKGRAKVRKSSKYKGGTAAGDNTRLVCYCKKHHAFAATLPGKAIHNKGAAGAAQAAASAAAALASAAAAAAAAATADSQQDGRLSRQVSPAVAAGGVGAAASLRALASSSNLGSSRRTPPECADVMLLGDSVVITAPAGTSARSRQTDMSTRRQMKAPDAAAVAQRKRLYLQSLPHLVTGCAGLPLLPPPISRIRYTVHEQQQAQQQEVSAAADDAVASAAPAAAGSSALCASAAAGTGILQLLQSRLPSADGLTRHISGGGSGSGSGKAGRGRRSGSAPLSQADRYRLMLDTANDRLCSGKSAIHGLGVFVKRPHKAGDYLIEYMGHLVRPVMTDHLERTTYNDMVGAGTYIFRLTDESSVDATRGGNMAHLINHSCAPVAHSRMISVRHPVTQQLVDHVIIVASRDLQPGDEVTYDYRFASDDKLRCNCGASTCRGFVNAPSTGPESPKRRAGGAGVLLLPRGEVEILRGEAAAAALAGMAFPAMQLLPQM